MGDFRGARWPRTGLLRRPADPVERVRWLFALSALSALLVTPIGMLVAGDRWTVALLAVSCSGLAVSWVHRYRTREVPLALDLTDAACLLLFALACTQPAIAFGVVVPALWFRGAYGSNGRVAGYAAGACLAVSLAVPLWGVVPGQAAGTPVAPVLGSLPVIAINALVARHLALGLFQRDLDHERDRALAAFAGRLIGVTDRLAVVAASWVTAEAICRSTPGLRLSVVYDEGGDALRVSGTAGGWRRQPRTLPRGLLPAASTGEEAAVITAPPPELVLASGVAGEWMCLDLPDTPGGHLLLGATPRVPREGIVATRSMLAQVALALRTCDAHAELRAQARTDGLTGLANRPAFSAALVQALATPDTESWLLFLDLDDFKVVNDQLGHLAGDRLLAHLGVQLRSVLRTGDLCARLGGDEFAVLLRGAGEADARAIGERLVQLVSTPVQLAEGLARIGARNGVTRVPAGQPESLVVHQADVAMYAAKAAGKNRVQFFSPGLLRADDRAAAEAELRAAVAEGQLVLGYQPVLSAADGRCTAVAASVRWQHPVRGLLGPEEFLGPAEETGAVLALGEWVLRTACADAAGWDDGTTPVALHVDASPLQLADPQFVDVVRAALADAGLAAGRLVVEVTETTALDSPAVSATLHELVGLGVRIALDGFGTGRSALATVGSLPIDVVTIDASLVAGALTRTADAALVEAIVGLAGRLGLTTVAEGVESAEQEAFLRVAGVTALQGSRHLRPAPAAEFGRWLAGDRRRASDGELTPA